MYIRRPAAMYFISCYLFMYVFILMHSEQKVKKYTLSFAMAISLSTCNNPTTIRWIFFKLCAGGFTRICWHNPVLIQIRQQ
jgi:hypothetical protein